MWAGSGAFGDQVWKLGSKTLSFSSLLTGGLSQELEGSQSTPEDGPCRGESAMSARCCTVDKGFDSLGLAPKVGDSDTMMNVHESHTTDGGEHLRPV